MNVQRPFSQFFGVRTMAMASSSVYRENRAKFSLEELQKFDGQWVAFSNDGRRIVASAPTIADLASQIRTANNSLQDVVLERIEMDSLEVHLGGAELL
jgi:hypothetical protein